MQAEQVHAKGNLQQHLRAEHVWAERIKAESKQQSEGKKAEAGTKCFC